MMHTCELIYGNGGSGGSYFDQDSAVRRAASLLRGSQSEKWIKVIVRDGGKASIKVSKTEDDYGDTVITAEGYYCPIEHVHPGDQFRHDSILYLAIRATRVGILNINAVRVWDGELSEIPAGSKIERIVLADN